MKSGASDSIVFYVCRSARRSLFYLRFRAVFPSLCMYTSGLIKIMTAIGRDYSLILLFDDPPMTDSGRADGLDRQFQYSVVLIILNKAK